MVDLSISEQLRYSSFYMYKSFSFTSGMKSKWDALVTELYVYDSSSSHSKWAISSEFVLTFQS